MARPLAATIPKVDPNQIPNQLYWAANVTVASMVLSPSSARTKAAVTAMIVDVSGRARSDSSVVGELPRSVHTPNAKNVIAAAADSH